MRSILPVSILAALVFVAAPIWADRSSSSSIVRQSPFLPANFNPPGGAGSESTVPASESKFLFKGVYQLDGEYFFHLYDQGSQKGTWISRSELASGFPRVIQFQESEDMLIVEMNGERMQLSMISTNDNPVPLSNNKPASRTVRAPQQPFRSMTGINTSRRPVIRPNESSDQGPTVRRATFSPQQRNN